MVELFKIYLGKSYEVLSIKNPVSWCYTMLRTVQPVQFSLLLNSAGKGQKHQEAVAPVTTSIRVARTSSASFHNTHVDGQLLP